MSAKSPMLVRAKSRAGKAHWPDITTPHENLQIQADFPATNHLDPAFMELLPGRSTAADATSSRRRSPLCVAH
jgi:hypothetical protein